ncbi:efflux RND transporter permease subunit [Thiomicrorhabdus lithotrophica]|uniref:Efflux RND transporter permease subunit n=1 Tax=Thiomicrorhabdus lithotrophica TaxID=2949997 RepID=A0ABY8C9V1_9GAMM|nr:efflux RND transporter permease subunit [Thiomicrorhabdus lithotrophica]WEJ62753.1 efflux RND transporter permease subunit [Thiomicrorhabdus lithotrophica]
MWLSDTSVKRPILATVASLLLLAFGLMAFDRMSLREYPNVDAPIVTIDTKYLGASAKVVENRITKLIENRISGVSGIQYIESTSSDGRSNIKVEFSIERDIDDAANDIRDRVARIADNLPEQATAPEVEKVDGDESVIMWFNLVSDQMTVPQLTDYAERYLVDRFSVLDGVARVRVGGGQSYALRIWLNPQKMALYGVTTSDIEAQLRAANAELPIGALQGEHILFTLQADKPLSSIKELQNLIIKQNQQIGQLTLKDVAEVKLGAIERRRLFRGNGIPMVGIGIIKQSTANTLTVANLARDRKEIVNKSLPAGLEIKDSYDSSVFVQQAVNEVYKTLFIALGLVSLVMLAFLKSWRMALVPMVTLPVSLIATFGILWTLGFSINLLTLLALVLAIGLVVDDAIVVLENTQRHIDMGHKPIAAAYLGTRQVGFAVIATTLTLIAVFLPIAFLEGQVGRLFSEFAITLAVAVLFSSWVALTLSPALASNLLKARKPKTENFIEGQASARRPAPSHLFKKLLVKNLRYAWVSLLIFISVIGAGVYFSSEVPKEYVPKEDRGAFFVVVKGPEGATYEYMQSYMNEIEERLMPLVDNGEAKRLLIRAPRSFSSTEIFNTGFVIIVLEDWAHRRSAYTIMNEIRGKLSDLTGVKAFPVMRSPIGGRIQKPVQFVIGGSSYEQLEQWQQMMNQAIQENNPGLVSVDWDYEPNKPQIDIKVDYDKAAALGISHQDVTETLQMLLGSKRVTTYQHEGEEIDIYLKADHKLFTSPKDFEQIYLRSATTDQMVPLSSITKMTTSGEASSLNRYNRVRSMTLSAKLEDGYSLDQALTDLQTLTRATLPPEAIIDYKGQSRDFQNSSNSFFFVFILGILVIYLVLAAQFESFIHPMVILLTVPMALAGGLFALLVFNMSLNIYSQIALVLLLGLATKNGILIVEFTNQLRDKGYSTYHALVSATKLRLRPILMTAVTTIAGTLPLIFSSGAGAETRYILGVVLFFGVAFSTLLSLFIIPSAYALIAKNSGSPLASTHKLEKALQDN